MFNTIHCEQNFIDSLQESSTTVQVYLISGSRLIGRILGSDDYTILMSRSRPGTQMIYKTAITTIAPFEDKNNEQ